MFPFLRQNLLKSDLIHYEMKIGKIMKNTLMYWFLQSKINFFIDTMKSSPGQYGPCGIGGLILETYKKLFFPFNFPFLTLLPDKCPICHFSCIRPYTYENRFRMRSKRRGLKNEYVRIHSRVSLIIRGQSYGIFSFLV